MTLPVLSASRGTINEAARSCRSERPLTHLIDLTDRQDAMKATRPLLDESAMLRFTAKLQREGECLVFTGSCNEHGYGRIYFAGGLMKAHRFAWITAFGPIPAGLHVLHHCDNPPCCNPEHLFLGTHQDNMADMDSKDRGGGAAERRRTHCPSGHPYDEANTVRIPSRPNARYCRECRAASIRKRNAKRRKSA